MPAAGAFEITNGRETDLWRLQFLICTVRLRPVRGDKVEIPD